MNSTRLLATALLGAAACAPAPRVASPAPGDRPNLVVILADDLGFSDIGSYGGEIPTPHLDRLAAGGVRFTQFYNAARCSPTRAALLSGLYPHQAGLGHMPDGYAARVRATFASPAYDDRLSLATPTIAEALRGAGYATYMSGKWHVGYERPHWPVDRGFDRSFALLGGAANFFGYGAQNGGGVGYAAMVIDTAGYQPPRDGFFLTDAFSDRAAEMIRSHDASRPFFLYLAYTAPHWPLHAPEADIAPHRGRYRAVGWDRLREARWRRLVGQGIIDPSWPLAPRPDGLPAWEAATEEQQRVWDEEMAIYAAQVEGMDRGIGRVLDTLRERGMDRNTLVLFLSDNGGANEDPNRSQPGATLGDRNSYEGYGLRGAHVSSAPFRLTKKFTHEGGIATPLIARWPAGLPGGGALRRDPAHLVDLAPTLLELAGARPLATEGVSLVPALAGRPIAERTLFWEHEGHRAVRQGRWKLVSRYSDPWELFDMETDRTEQRDLAAGQPDRVRRMEAQYEAWAARVGAQPWQLVAPAK